MRQAYQNLYGGSGSHIVATHQYVRFKPTSKEQLLTLIETLDLDLYDTPLDYKLAREGDYYQDPSIPDEEITWQYTVVPVNFTYPSGIQYELLSSIYIPSDSDYLMEAEAERLVGLNEDGDDLLNPPIAHTQPIEPIQESLSFDFYPCEVMYCRDGYVWDSEVCNCVPSSGCPLGYYWDNLQNECVPDDAPLPPTTSPTTSPPQQTGGSLFVEDTQLGNEGIQNVRVVAKRWFKIERMYTNSNGFFNSTKKFRNQVKLVVKFKNDDAVIRGMRGARFWQMLYPVQKKFGPMKGSAINNFTHTFEINNKDNSKGARFWVAATTHNAVQQFKAYSIQEGTGSLPNRRLKILLTSWGLSGAGSAPLFAIRQIDNIGQTFLSYFVASAASPAAGSLVIVAAVLKSQLDISYSYNFDSTPMTSDRVTNTIYHELAHATLYPKTGNDWYSTVVNGTIAEIMGSGPSPYGDGTTSHSPLIAMNEGWANHYGRFLAHLRYGANSSDINRQGQAWEFTHLAYLENYNPRFLQDDFRWIPEGLFLDLIDNTPDETRAASRPVDDAVSGFTNLQLFNAIDSDVRSPQNYRLRLMQENNNNQVTQVTNLFNQYGY